MSIKFSIGLISISTVILSIIIPSFEGSVVAQTKKPTINTKPCVRQELPKLKQGMPYSKAREMLLEAGWQAIFNREILNSERSAPVDYFFTKKEYTEIQDCAGSGLGLCYFRFESAYGEILSVVTANNFDNEENLFRWYIEEKEPQE